jgi:protein gp37
MIFVNSIYEIFHQDVFFEFVRMNFDVIKRVTELNFQILTKRSEIKRIRRIYGNGGLLLKNIFSHLA